MGRNERERERWRPARSAGAGAEDGALRVWVVVAAVVALTFGFLAALG